MQNNRCAIVHRSLGLRTWLKTSLLGLGYKVVSTSATTEDGFRHACLLKPDLMLVEVGVAGSEEYSGIRLMRDIQRQLPMPVIYIARGLGPKMIEAARSTRPLGFLNRPLRVRDLLGMLEVYRGRYYAPPAPYTPGQVREPASGGDGSNSLQARLCGILDCLAVGVIIVHQGLRFEYANLMGRRILRKGAPLKLVGGCLRLNAAGLERRLCRLVRQSSCGSLLLTRDHGMAPELRILACPIPGGSAGCGPMVLYLTDSREQLQEVELQLQQLHGLTRAESRVARTLLVRPSRMAVAEHLFISPQTVGTHLQNIYGKLGVHNQHELIHFIVMGPAGKLLRMDDVVTFRKEEYCVGTD